MSSYIQNLSSLFDIYCNSTKRTTQHITEYCITDILLFHLTTAIQSNLTLHQTQHHNSPQKHLNLESVRDYIYFQTAHLRILSARNLRQISIASSPPPLPPPSLYRSLVRLFIRYFSNFCLFRYEYHLELSLSLCESADESLRLSEIFMKIVGHKSISSMKRMSGPVELIRIRMNNLETENF